jgi:hypothetical protein
MRRAQPSQEAAGVPEWIHDRVDASDSVGTHTSPGLPAPLLNAVDASALLGVPKSWLLDAARRDQAPHIRLGRYVRFDAAELLAWASGKHHRGPRVPVTDRAPLKGNRHG